jgi:hypothetical protein
MQADDKKNSMFQSIFTELREIVSGYDPADFTTSLAALQLIPENADRTITLEALTHQAASVNTEDERTRISTEELDAVCNSTQLSNSSIARADDPLDNPLTEAFIFHGGSFVVFPGIADDAAFIFRHLTNALFFSNEPFPDASYQRQAGALIFAVLTVSTEIARRAGLGRGAVPISNPAGSIVVPEAERLLQLKRAVCFERDELSSLLTKGGVSPTTLDPLMVPIGSIPADEYDLEKGALLTYPLIKADDKIIVALPGRLLAATRNELIRLALEKGLKDELVKGYTLAVWRTVVQSLEYLRIPRIKRPSLPPLPSDVPHLHEGLFSLDSDKMLYALLVTDSLESYNPKQAYDRWPTRDIENLANQRLQQIDQYLVTLPKPPNEILFLILYQSTGRFYTVELREPGAASLPLTLSGADLETVAKLEAGEPLSLWKYAQAYWEIRQRTGILSASFLDEFYLYTRRDHSYYLSDEALPDVVVAAPGGSGELRREALAILDLHAAPSYVPGSILEVRSSYTGSDIPIYIPKLPPHERESLIVEGYPLPVWVIGAIYNHPSRRALQPNYKEFVEAIAYWLWQCTPSLWPILEVLAQDHDKLLIEVDFTTREEWARLQEQDAAAANAPVEVTTYPAACTLKATFRPTVSTLLGGPDNRGERELLNILLKEVKQLLPEAGHGRLSDEAISAIIDRHAPLGLKKKIITLDPDTTPELDRRDLPPYRKVQLADENVILDEIGEYLVQTEGLTAGPIDDNRRTEILRKVVDYCYREIEQLVASLNPAGLLEWLIFGHEAVTHKVAMDNLTMPTRQACFDSTGEFAKKIAKEIPENTSAGTASRFVIEYVAARPPSGLRPISLSVYDHLLALASQIIDFGFESDVIYFELADLKLSLLPSGRLGVERDDWQRAREAYLSAAAHDEIFRASKSFGRYWRSIEAPPDDDEVMIRLDAAAQAEFGYSMTELTNFTRDAYLLGVDLNPSVARVEIGEFITLLSGSLGWPEDRVRRALDLLSLAPRADFLSPPPPHKTVDVFPWKFNRALSYMRRPFLQREYRDRTEILWGNRHLYNAVKYLADLCASARLKATSPEMKRFLAQLNSNQGAPFERCHCSDVRAQA